MLRLKFKYFKIIYILNIEFLVFCYFSTQNTLVLKIIYDFFLKFSILLIISTRMYGPGRMRFVPGRMRFGQGPSELWLVTAIHYIGSILLWPRPLDRAHTLRIWPNFRPGPVRSSARADPISIPD